MTDGKAESLCYTIAEAGELLGIGRNSAYEAARDGSLPTIKIGKKTLRVPRAALHKMLENAKGGGAS